SWSTKSICGEFWRNSLPIIITRELTLRSGRTHRTRARSNALATLLHIRSLAGYTIDMLESSFWKRQAQGLGYQNAWLRCAHQWPYQELHRHVRPQAAAQGTWPIPRHIALRGS